MQRAFLYLWGSASIILLEAADVFTPSDQDQGVPGAETEILPEVQQRFAVIRLDRDKRQTICLRSKPAFVKAETA